MADRSVATTNTLNYFRHEYNATSADVGSIQSILDATGIIASATDVVESVTLLNTDLTAITTDAHIFGGGSIVFEGDTDDSYETTLAITDPTADRTLTLPNLTGTVGTLAGTETWSNKTFTSPAINAGTLSGAFTGTMDITSTVLSGASPLVFEGATADEYETTLAIENPTADRTVTMPNATDTIIGKATTDTLTNKSIDLDSNTFTGSLTEWNSALQSVSFVSLTGSETLTNKTLTSPTIDGGTFSGTFTGTMDISGTVLSGANALVFEGATADEYETTLAFVDPTADRVVTFFNATDTLVGKATTDTLTNKTIDLGSNTLTASLSEFNSALQGDSFGTLADTQTWTNKTFTSPIINSMTFASGQLSSGLSIGSTGIIFEGATDDAYETTITVVDPTADRTLTIPNETATLATNTSYTTKAQHIAKCIAMG